MPRISIHKKAVSAGVVTLPEAEAKRLFRVLRMKPGEHVTLFDGENEYVSLITALDAKSATLEIIQTTKRDTGPAVHITLGQGMPKGDRLEFALQKAVELGAGKVVPVVMERSVKRPDSKTEHKKLERLRRIATEAAQQSGRVSVPDVPGFMGLAEFLELTEGAELKLVLYEGETVHGIRNALEGAGHVASLSLLVGPEGGLSDVEVEAAKEAGYVPVSIGPRILRTETAGLAALSIIQFEIGDMG